MFHITKSKNLNSSTNFIWKKIELFLTLKENVFNGIKYYFFYYLFIYYFLKLFFNL